jgi:hypothetical protein
VEAAVRRTQGSRIEDDLKAYYQSAAMPCPYARLPTAYLHLHEDAASEATRQALRTALAQFWADERISILSIVPRGPYRDHAHARAQAYWLRYQWHWLHLEMVGEAQGLVRSRVEAAAIDLRDQYASWISDPLSFLGPRIRVGAADIMMTAFNPLYPASHARYAPHAVLPVIRSRDLRAVHESKPEVSTRIATHAKCKILYSMLADREGIGIEAMRAEFPEWLDAVSFYRDFVASLYTDSYRIDPRTLPRLAENRRRSAECMQSGQFRASLLAFRLLIRDNPRVPTLQRMLAQNPALTVFDVARVIFGDMAGMYVVP